MATKRNFRRWLRILLILSAVLSLLGQRWVVNSSEAYVYSSYALLPDNDVGVVLGTSPNLSTGRANPHFEGRIKAAVQLYHLGKVRHLIVSGYNPDPSYNEPKKMRQALIDRGVPASVITMDYGGVRTLDSIVRANTIFGARHFTVITQSYHANRAVFIGKKLKLDVSAYIAPLDESPIYTFKVWIREYFAQQRAILDLFFWNTQPRFGGKEEPLFSPPAPSSLPAEVPPSFDLPSADVPTPATVLPST